MANKTKKTVKTTSLEPTNSRRSDIFLLQSYLQTLANVYVASSNLPLLERAIATTINRIEAIIEDLIPTISKSNPVEAKIIQPPSLGFKKDGTPKKKPGPKKGQVTAVSASVPVTGAPTPFNVPAPPPPRVS